jgi:hypothetical protein
VFLAFRAEHDGGSIWLRNHGKRRLRCVFDSVALYVVTNSAMSSIPSSLLVRPQVNDPFHLRRWQPLAILVLVLVVSADVLFLNSAELQ